MSFFKKTTLCFILATSISACGVKDEPLPFTQENLNALGEKIQEQSKSITPSMGKDKARQDIEDDFGYSFDKTLRTVLLFQGLSVPATTLMSLPFMVISEDTKWALDNEYISKRTLEVIEIIAKTNGTKIDSEDMKFLDYVTECQKQNNGICNGEKLIPILIARGGLSVEESQRYPVLIDDVILGKYNVRRWLMSPNGGNVSAQLASNGNQDFILNKENIESSKKMMKIYEEEKKELGVMQ